jgi:hypothetical protein
MCVHWEPPFLVLDNERLRAGFHEASSIHQSRATDRNKKRKGSVTVAFYEGLWTAFHKAPKLAEITKLLRECRITIACCQDVKRERPVVVVFHQGLWTRVGKAPDHLYYRARIRRLAQRRSRPWLCSFLLGPRTPFEHALNDRSTGVDAAACRQVQRQLAFAGLLKEHGFRTPFNEALDRGQQFAHCCSDVRRERSAVVSFVRGWREAVDEALHNLRRHDGTLRRHVQRKASLPVLFLKGVRPFTDYASSHLSRRAMTGSQQVQRKALPSSSLIWRAARTC